ncbi:hypothetical protein HOY82DRAFT_542385 [Tuber indicum]|nr:hypothetical protein HOY82DRAFT_542385 [Tuber indicum]
MTYTHKNICASFEATGISPLNARRVLSQLPPRVKPTSSSPKHPSSSLVPNTPYHGKSIFIHTRRAIALLDKNSPTSKRHISMVEKLAKSAESATAENVILKEEIRQLKALTASRNQSMKVKSRKVLTKAVVISAEDIIKLREESDRKEQAAMERKKKSLAKDASQKPSKRSAKLSKSRTVAQGATDLECGIVEEEVEEIQVVELESGSEEEGWGSESPSGDGDSDGDKTRSQIIILHGERVVVLAEKLAKLGLANMEGTQKEKGVRKVGLRTRKAYRGGK